MRTGLAVLTTSMVLASAPAAFAAGFPTPTVASSHGSVTPDRGSFCMRTPTENMCGDHAFFHGPDLTVDPQGELTITLDADADAVAAYVTGPAPTGQVILEVRAVEPRKYAVTMPDARAFPGQMQLSLNSQDGPTVYNNTWTLRVVAPPAPPAPPASPAPPSAEAPNPAAALARTSLKLRGKGLAVDVACPATAKAGCSGVLTLKTPSLRVARIPFSNVAAGTSSTLRATVRGAVLRHMKRHQTKALRAVLTPTGGPSASMSLRLKRS